MPRMAKNPPPRRRVLYLLTCRGMSIIEKLRAPTPEGEHEDVGQMTVELRRVESVYHAHILPREDLSFAAKQFVLKAMRERPESEWGQVDGQDVRIHEIKKTAEGDLAVYIESYGYVTDARVIKIPEEMKV